MADDRADDDAPRAAAPREPGDDEPVTEAEASLTVIDHVLACFDEAEQARSDRDSQNQENLLTYSGKQDWSHKIEGQSTEFLPMLAMSVEQIAAFIKRGLVDFGQWFGMEVPPGGPLTSDQARDLLSVKLEHLNRDDENKLDFATLVSDGTKVGILQSMIVLKIHGADLPKRTWIAKRGTKIKTVSITGPGGAKVGETQVPHRTSSLVQREIHQWRLLIELVQPNDYYQDPTGNGLYKIQRIRRDLADVIDMSEGEDPIYDPDAVAQIEADYRGHDTELDEARMKQQNVATSPGFRKQVEILEYWGDLLDEDGHVAHRNIVCAVANQKYLIRPPEPNPFWHGQSPFVAAPLMRVPFSVNHKAIADMAGALNLAANELFSLLLDGGLAAVWGTRQVRPGMLERPEEIANGIPQGKTLQVKDELPIGAKVLERIDTGEAPQYAFGMFQTLKAEYNLAALTSELRAGNLPQKDTKATEVIAAQHGIDTVFDGMIHDCEKTIIEPALWKAWAVMMQHMDDLDAQEVVTVIGPRAALALGRMTPAERFVTYVSGAKVRVTGLSAMASAARDFAKITALLQATGSNPLLLQAFLKRFSGDKLLTQMLRAINLNPQSMEADAGEMGGGPGDRLAQLAAHAQVTGGAPGRNGALPAAESGGRPDIPAEVNQNVNPLSGLTANA